MDALVVDDDPELARTTVDVLGSEGITAGHVPSVEEALAYVAEDRVRCLILDHNARLEGPEMLLDLAGTLPPILLVSGDPEGLARCAEVWGERVFAYRVKPVPPTVLVALVKRALVEARA